MSSASPSYRGHRYPVEVIAHCVWLYFRFPLRFREVEELMLERGAIVSYESIRRWCLKFGQTYANGLRRRRPRPCDKWHLDEVFIFVAPSTMATASWTTSVARSRQPRPTPTGSTAARAPVSPTLSAHRRSSTAPACPTRWM